MNWASWERAREENGEDEKKRFTGRLFNLTDEEQQIYQLLQQNRLGENLRLEQERIPFQLLEARIALLLN